MRTHYKAVRVYRGHCRSFIVDSRSRHCVRYKIGEEATGYKGTPLLIFERLRDALAFASNLSGPRGYVILAGKAKGIRQAPDRLVGGPTTRGVVSYWRWVTQGGPPSLAPVWAGLATPRGTVLADSFTPERAIGSR